LYVVDMYRGIIQHHTYITEYLRDQIASRSLEQPIGLGRIYRVVHDSTVRDRMTLPATAPGSELVKLLSHPNGWWRDTAQRLLVEREDRSTAPALTALAESAPDWRTRLHALWTLDGLNAVTPATVAKALDDSARDVRAAAIRIAERWLGEEVHPLQSQVIAMVNHSDWAVRQQAVASLGSLPPGLRERSLAAVLAGYSLDPIVADTALSGLRGGEAAVLTMLLQPDVERSPSWQRPSPNQGRKVPCSSCSRGLQTPHVRTGSARHSCWERRSRLQVRLCQGHRRLRVRQTPRTRRVRRALAGARDPVVRTPFRVRPIGRDLAGDRMLRPCG
jgi:hypothetical protein